MQVEVGEIQSLETTGRKAKIDEGKIRSHYGENLGWHDVEFVQML